MMTPDERIYEEIKTIRENAQNVHSSNEQEWISNHLDNCELGSIIKKLSIVALHMLSSLEEGPKTGVELATAINVTRGAVTRASKNLVKYGLITAQKKETNKKNIYYSLTPNGLEVAKAHDDMHCQMKQVVVNELTSKYSKKELSLIADFLQDFNALENKI